MIDDFSNGRRKLCVLIGSMLAGSPALLFSGCGGSVDTSGASSPSSASSPAATPPPAKAPVGGVGYLFDSTDSRLLALVSPTGAWGTYLGTKDSTGNPVSVTGFIYEDPDSTQNFVIRQTDAELDIVLDNGDRFAVVQTGSGYAFTISSASSGETFSGNFVPTAKAISPSGLPVTVARAAQRNTCAYAVSKAEESAGTMQAVFVKVTDDCGAVVSSGTASATIRADAGSQTQQVGEELIKLPPLPVELSFDAARGGFYGQASLKNFDSNLSKLGKDLFIKGATIILEEIEKQAVVAAALLILSEIPFAGLAAILIAESTGLLRAGDLYDTIQEIADDLKTAWDLGEDFYELASSPNPSFPIDVTARYSNGAIQQSDTKVVSTPGATEADFTFTIDTGAPCAGGPAIAGDWSGSLTQPNGPITDIFEFSMSFEVNGNQVTGSSQIVAGPEFANMSLTGTLTGDRLQFAETAITSQIQPPNGVVWCLKTGTLTLAQGASGSSLSGSWTAISPPGCLPGAINLTKVVATS